MKRKDCDECGANYRKKSLRKRKGRLICHRCYGKELTIIPALDPKRSIKTMEREERERRIKIKKKQDKLKERQEVPKIKGSRIKKISRKNHIYITSEEKGILYKKYISMDYDPHLASEKVNNICNYLSKLVQEVRKKKIEEEKINQRLKEEWAKLVN